MGAGQARGEGERGAMEDGFLGRHISKHPVEIVELSIFSIKKENKVTVVNKIKMIRFLIICLIISINLL